MKQKSVTGVPGVVYRIPLFFTDVSPLQRFSKKDFPVGEERYAYCRVISDKQGAGILIEVFNFIGAEASEDEILLSGRIFDPVVIIGDGIKRNRWQKVFDFPDFDAETDAGLSVIEKKIADSIDSGVGFQSYSSIQLERHIVESLPDQTKEKFGIFNKEINS